MAFAPSPADEPGRPGKVVVQLDEPGQDAAAASQFIAFELYGSAGTMSSLSGVDMQQVKSYPDCAIMARISWNRLIRQGELARDWYVSCVLLLSCCLTCRLLQVSVLEPLSARPLAWGRVKSLAAQQRAGGRVRAWVLGC